MPGEVSVPGEIPWRCDDPRRTMKFMRNRVIRTGGIVALLAPACLDAQVVRGRVIQGDSTGVPGVVVLLQHPDGRVAARALSLDRGEYRIVAPAAGDYSLRTLRIGFRPAS